VRKLREDLSFDEEERKRLAFVQVGSQIRWNDVRATLKRLNDKKKLTDDHYSLHSKFVNPPSEEK